MEINEKVKDSILELNDELKILVSETKLLLKTTDEKREAIVLQSEKTMEGLESVLKQMEQENLMLQRIPRKIQEQLNENVPAIAAELQRLGEQEREKSAKFFEEQIGNYNKTINDAALRLKEIKNEILTIDKKRFKRSTLTFLGTILIASLISGLISYILVEKFPHHVTLRNTEQVNITDSKITFWNSQEEVAKMKKR